MRRVVINIKKIIANNGDEIIVDNDDYDRLNDFKWSICGGYATTYYNDNGQYTYEKMHRMVLGIENTSKLVDHINRDTLDNRKSNLRIATTQQNAMNKRKAYGNFTSKYKGVRKKDDKWEAYIYLNNKVRHLGSFSNEDAAANAYNYHAKLLFKEFANFNNVVCMDYDQWNKYKSKTKSKYIGVSLHNENGKWTATIGKDYKKYYLGIFDTEEEAASAYNQKAIELFGEGNKKLNNIEV